MNTLEIYREIENNYAVSNFGNFINNKGKLIKGSLHPDYIQVQFMTQQGKQTSQSLHILVAKAFLENLNGLPCVYHKDKNKLNNNVSNLEWSKKRPPLIQQENQEKYDETFNLKGFFTIPGHDNYMISKKGIVIDTLKKLILKQYQEQNGYMSFYCDGKRKRMHRVLGEVFVNKGEYDYFIVHKDGNKRNNKTKNLIWDPFPSLKTLNLNENKN